MTTTWTARIGAIALAVSIAIGTSIDPDGRDAPTVRAGYRVLQIDLHAHTTFSDGTFSPFDVVLQARRRGLDAVAVTEHNLLFPARMARWFSTRIGGPTVLLGEEVTSARAHVVAVGIEHAVAPGPLDEVIASIHAQHGIAIAAHPVKLFWPATDPVATRFDGAEVMHPVAWSVGRSGWRWSEMRDWWLRVRDERAKDGEPFAAIGSSDAHFGATLGMDRTLVFARDDDATSIVDALRAGRTVTWDLEGNAYGDPAMIDALARDPLPVKDRHAHRPQNVLDRASRLLGLAGALLVLFFRRRA
jgi:predicted metal-dependent phosphoesterase TrpH